MLAHQNFDISYCCLTLLFVISWQEKSWNPYYGYLALKLLDHGKGHRVTLQYCLWDQFKELNGMDARRLTNLAHFMALMASKVRHLPRLHSLLGLLLLHTAPSCSSSCPQAVPAVLTIDPTSKELLITPSAPAQTQFCCWPSITRRLQSLCPS